MLVTLSGMVNPPDFPVWILNKYCLGFVVKHTILTAIDGITCVNNYAGQTGAIIKRISPMLVTLFPIVTLVKPVQL